ncbi:MAG TPA: LacI family DNA-binding transcriptional regulator [Allosphingosinicella sp.]|jgi:LacI family transcriptional regulator
MTKTISPEAPDLSRQKRKTVTIKHVAAEASVSLQTVSRVINNGPNVTPKVQERVNAAIKKLGYVPSLAARRLGGSRSYLILALNDRHPTVEGWLSRRGNDWVDQMLLGGMLKCEEYGYRMLFELVDAHSEETLNQVQAALSSLRPDGVILTPPHTENHQIMNLLIRNGVPFARIGSQEGEDGYCIFMDEVDAAAAATDHLLDLGHRRIGFITGHADYSGSRHRLQGYRLAMERRDLEVREEWIQPGDFSYASGVAATEALMAAGEKVTGVVASNDETALAVLHTVARFNLQVPGDISIVSFDDTPTVRLSVPPLTAIRQPIAPMTARASELLIEEKSTGRQGSARQMLPFELILRESTAAPSA